MRPATIWIVGTLIATLSRPIGAAIPHNSDQPQRRISISAYDLAHISPKTMARAERVASDIFVAAGIEVEWTIGSPSDASHLVTDFSPVPQGRCTGPLDLAVVRVQILPHASKGFRSGALGFALPCAELGVQVTIFADRVEGVSGKTLAVFYRVLGHALAHEVGHVLLGSCLHEDSGLMKGVWTKEDWVRAAVSLVPFTPDQSRRMAERLANGSPRELAGQIYNLSTAESPAESPFKLDRR